MIYQKLYHYIKKQGFFDSHQKILIAVSGGVDSMNLLHFLYLYREKFNVSIGIAHVNHKQRVESEAEENYLTNWAKDHDIPIFIAHFSGEFSEENARGFRYHFFKTTMFENDYTALVTAHHADDQVETIFMKLIRGSRLRHLIGIKEIQDFGPGQLIRPFLTISKTELPNDIFYFEDASNKSSAYFRNRVRNNYLPQLNSENSQFSSHLLYLAKENAHLQEALLSLTKDMDITNLSFFNAQHFSLKYVLLQQYLEQFSDLQLSKVQFDQLLSLLTKSNSYHGYLKAGYYLHKSQERFTISKISPQTDSVLPFKMLEYQNNLNYEGISFIYTNSGDGIPLFSLSPVIIRGRLPGDKIHFGHFSKKIRRLLIDEKIPLEERQKVIVGEQDGEIIFVKTNQNLYLRKLDENDTMKAVLLIENIGE